MSALFDEDTYYDTPRELHGKRRVEYPLEKCPTASVFSTSYVVNASAYVQPTFADTCPETGYTSHYWVEDVEEKREGVLLWYRRVWASVPDDWDDSGSIVYQFPAIWLQREPVSLVAATRVAHTYMRTDAPSDDFTPIDEFSPAVTGYAYARVPVVAPNTTPTDTDYLASIAAEDEIVAAGSEIFHYRGGIWGMRTTYVKAK